MIDENQARETIGSTAYTQDGDKLGKVGQLFLDDSTGRPEFVTVNTGLFGTNESFVPVGDATFDGDRLTVPYTKDQVKNAPNVDVDGGHLDEADEDRLYAHYEMGGPTDRAVGDDDADQTAYDDQRVSQHDDRSADSGADGGADGVVRDGAGVGSEGRHGADRSGDDAMTRSEERLEVGTTAQERGRVRLRKYVTTEQETRTVPVRKERAVVETEPVTDANVGDATSGPDITEDEHEVVLHEERPVVDKVAEPVERVRLGTETDVEEQQVTEDVRKEHVEVDGDDNHRDR